MSNVPSSVEVPQISGTPQAKIDNNQVVTTEGPVQRQVVTVADAAQADNYQAVNSDGGAGVTVIPLSASQLTLLLIDNGGTAGDFTIAPAAVGKTNKLMRLILFVDNPTRITFKNGATPLSGGMQLLESGNIILDFSGDPWYQSSVDEPLIINSSMATQLSGTAWYAQS